MCDSSSSKQIFYGVKCGKKVCALGCILHQNWLLPENLPAAEEPMPTRKHRANRPLCILRLGRRRPVRNQIADEAERSPGLVCSVTVRIRRSTSETEGIVISNETGESSQKGP